MSFMIRGMQKPKDCGICPFELDGFPDEWELHCKLLGRQVGYFDKKNKVPKDCPIIEVPTPRERLIDADDLMHEFAKFVRASNNSDFAPVPTWNDAVSLLGSAPTIIEAEENNHD